MGDDTEGQAAIIPLEICRKYQMYASVKNIPIAIQRINKNDWIPYTDQLCMIVTTNIVIIYQYVKYMYVPLCK